MCNHVILELPSLHGSSQQNKSGLMLMRKGEIGHIPKRSAGGGKVMPGEACEPTEDEVESMRLDDVLPDGSGETFD